jgi:tRNA threonylcarbamoyl adenosine modification protein (Sua5/YciO/YrdC/YwlC family)
MLLDIHPKDPESRKIAKVVECLRNGGVIVYPTDTVYAMGCDILNTKALEQLCRIKGIKPEKSNFSIICSDLSHLSEYTLNVDTPTYKMLRRAFPGPFTFILKANNNIPKLFKNNKKTIGIRVPNHNIPKAIVMELGNPIVTTSIHSENIIQDYLSEAWEIEELMGHLVDIVIDGGTGGIEPSTIIDCTGDEPYIIREGKGDSSIL